MSAQTVCAAQFLREQLAMLYVATSFWLTVAVLLAWGVHYLWSTVAKPKAVNAVLLPGTLVAQLGHIVGLLITGATVNNTSLMRNDDKGGPETDPAPQPRLPVIGPVIVALLPMLALGFVLYLVIAELGMPVVQHVNTLQAGQITRELPGTLPAFWDQLRALVTLAEGTLAAVCNGEGGRVRMVVFVYLMICLTVRMAPLPGNVRGHIGAIVGLGIAGWLAGSLSPKLPEMITQTWPLLTLIIGWLLLLLMISLVVRGAIGSIRMIIQTN
ncbi:MAG: hypothetical protein ABII12_01270 [Planctomycetota bacterium]